MRDATTCVQSKDVVVAEGSVLRRFVHCAIDRHCSVAHDDEHVFLALRMKNLCFVPWMT